MKKLQVREFDPAILNNATLICNGSTFTDTYRLENGKIFKRIKSYDCLDYDGQNLYYDFCSNLYKKLQLSNSISDSSVVTPDGMYMNKDGLVGYTVPFVDLKSFDYYLSGSKDLDFITDSFIAVANAVKNLHNESIILPDLASPSNILFDPETKLVKFIDYDGLQIQDLCSFNISSVMFFGTNLFFYNSKYYNFDNNIFTSDFDKASLLALYLLYTVNTRLAEYDYRFISPDKENRKWSMKDGAINYLFDYNGIKSSPLEDDIRRVYSNDIENKFLNSSIEEMRKAYTIDFSRHTFIKR